MQTIALKPLLHNGAECIGIFSKPDTLLNAIFKKEAGARWSRTHTCWYVPFDKNNYTMLANAVRGKAILLMEGLKEFPEKNKTPGNALSPEKGLSKKEVSKLSPLPYKPVVSKENEAGLKKFNQQLILKAYSASCGFDTLII